MPGVGQPCHNRKTVSVTGKQINNIRPVRSTAITVRASVHASDTILKFYIGVYSGPRSTVRDTAYHKRTNANDGHTGTRSAIISTATPMQIENITNRFESLRGCVSIQDFNQRRANSEWLV